mgnify:CR=1 FL=1
MVHTISSESSSEDEAPTKKASVKPKLIRKSEGKPPASSSSSEDEDPPAKTPSKAKFGAVPPPDFGTPVRLYTLLSKFKGFFFLYKMTKSTPAVKKSNLKPGRLFLVRLYGYLRQNPGVSLNLLSNSYSLLQVYSVS